MKHRSLWSDSVIQDAHATFSRSARADWDEALFASPIQERFVVLGLIGSAIFTMFLVWDWMVVEENILTVVLAHLGFAGVLFLIVLISRRYRSVSARQWITIIYLTVLSVGVCVVLSLGNISPTLPFVYCLMFALLPTFLWSSLVHFIAHLAGTLGPAIVLILFSGVDSLTKINYVLCAMVAAVLATGSYNVFRMIHGRVRELLDRLMVVASHDHVTGLLNRSSWYVQASEMIAHAIATQTPISLIYIDLDQFKRINDEFGHAAGDRVLEQIAQCLVETARSETLPARIGGEEFVILLPTFDLDAALTLANQLHDRFETITDLPLKVTASMGIAQYIRAESLEDLINRADNAMLRAKRDGRNASAVSTSDHPVDPIAPREKRVPVPEALSPAVAEMTIQHGSLPTGGWVSSHEA